MTDRHPTAAQIREWVRADGPLPHPDRVIEVLNHDSRTLRSPGRTLFIALRGTRRDGHEFLPELYRRGVRSFLVERTIPQKQFPEANILQVENTTLALQQIAGIYRKRFDIPILAITGSNGKTIVKEWLNGLLRPDFQPTVSPGSWNSQVGVPLSVYQLNDRSDIGVFEAGISERGEMEVLRRILQPTHGLITNLGPAHAAGFSSDAEKLEEKIALFESCETIFFCRDHQEIHAALRRRYPDKRLLSWSELDSTAELYIAEERSTLRGRDFRLVYNGTEFSLHIPFTDRAARENALHSVLILLGFGIPSERFAKRFEHLPGLDLRLRRLEGIGGSVLIDDAYSFDLKSLQNALTFLEQQRADQERVAILSDMVLAPDSYEATYRELADLLREQQIERVLGVGKEIERLATLLPADVRCRFYATTEELLEQLRPETLAGCIVLIKGARRFRLERVTERLRFRLHRTVLEVNLNALIRNLHTHASHLPPHTKMLAMVKADAYGAGAIEVAKMLAFHHVDYLGVAYTDEGVELRRAGIRTPILVLNPDSGSFRTLLENQLEPEIYSVRQFREFLSFVRPSDRVPVHLKLDTGMHRLGFTPDDLEDLLPLIAGAPNLRVVSVFSHLAAAESDEEDEFTHRQVALFENMYARIVEQLGYRPMRHVLNSAGMVRFPEYGFEMVRLGLGLYGVSDALSGLATVMQLKSTISQIKELQAGETIGYGRRGRLEQDGRIGTVGIGYADGILRAAGNGEFSVMVRGRLAPIVGSVCMDMCMIDLSGIPEAVEGDTVLFFGERLSVRRLASAAGTIPYEIFPAVSRRVRRVYHTE